MSLLLAIFLKTGYDNYTFKHYCNRKGDSIMVRNILEGKGIFVDNDGSRSEVGPGDVCYIEVGQSHSLENPTDENLVFIALIYNE